MLSKCLNINQLLAFIFHNLTPWTFCHSNLLFLLFQAWYIITSGGVKVPFYLKSEGYSENGDKKFILHSCVRWNEKTVCVLIFHQNTNPIFPLTPFLSKAKIMHYSHWSPSNYASSLFDTNHQTYISHLHIWPTHNLGTSGTLFCIASHRLGSGLLTSQRGLCSVTHTI